MSFFNKYWTFQKEPRYSDEGKGPQNPQDAYLCNGVEHARQAIHSLNYSSFKPSTALVRVQLACTFLLACLILRATLYATSAFSAA